MKTYTRNGESQKMFLPQMPHNSNCCFIDRGAIPISKNVLLKIGMHGIHGIKKDKNQLVESKSVNEIQNSFLLRMDEIEKDGTLKSLSYPIHPMHLWLNRFFLGSGVAA